MLFSCITKMPSFWASAQHATKWIPVCKLLQLPKCQRLDWPSSVHSACFNLLARSFLSGSIARVCRLSALPFRLLDENICLRCVMWCKVSMSSVSQPQPQPQQRPGPPTLPPHVSHINLMSEKWLLRNHDSSGPCFCMLIESPRAQTPNTPAVIHLYRRGGPCQGAGVKWFVF